MTCRHPSLPLVTRFDQVEIDTYRIDFDDGSTQTIRAGSTAWFELMPTFYDRTVRRATATVIDPLTIEIGILSDDYLMAVDALRVSEWHWRPVTMIVRYSEMQEART